MVYTILNVFVFAKGYYESRFKRNAFGLTPGLLFLGVIVWGDAVIFGPFWIFASAVVLLLKDWYLFLLIISVFWLVRSLGETIYWFNQQFSSINRNSVKKLPWNSVFHNDAVWFVHQIVWQCVTVVSIITTIYLTNLWLR